MRGKLLLLYQQRLVQLTLVLLDLLLHVGDCTCNLHEKKSSVITMCHMMFWAVRGRETRLGKQCYGKYMMDGKIRKRKKKMKTVQVKELKNKRIKFF